MTKVNKNLFIILLMTLQGEKVMSEEKLWLDVVNLLRSVTIGKKSSRKERFFFF